MKSIKKFPILIITVVCLLFSIKSYGATLKISSTTVSATISKGKSYEFLNKSKKVGQVKVNGLSNTSYDYVVYNKTKSVVTSKLADWGTSIIKVPSGGKVVITGQSNVKVKASATKSVFKVKASSSPAFARFNVSKGKSYEFMNKSKKEGSVQVVGLANTDFDYVVYDKAKNVVFSRISGWGTSSITVPSGGKVVITGQGKKPVIAGGPKLQFQGKASSKPAFTRFTISQGKSYEFLNTSKKEVDVRVDGLANTDFDYVVYDKAKNVVFSRISAWGTSSITVPSGGKVVITGQGKKPVIAGGPKLQFQGKTSRTPAFTRFTIPQGKSYEFLNRSQEEGQVKIYGLYNSRYDYVVYDKSNNVVTSNLAGWGTGTIMVPSGGKVVITVQSKESIKAGGPKLQFQGKTSNTPAFTRFTIPQGKSYEFLNRSQKEGQVMVYGLYKSSYDYVVYDKANNVVTSKLAEWGTATIKVPSGGKVVITGQGKESIIAGGPQSLFTGKAIQ
ncbi:hypothetical protein ACQKP0_12705 [Heyndrickxia sp. NPDC080065]|uniref:hypothetical protein n=1 Tax=Heyndrickxia sp. NPDC080065 TaxID=3390568 RepID=UPI003D08EC54